MTLKQGLLEAVDTFIKTNTHGYTSRAEVISTATRRFLEEHGHTPQTKAHPIRRHP